MTIRERALLQKSSSTLTPAAYSYTFTTSPLRPNPGQPVRRHGSVFAIAERSCD